MAQWKNIQPMTTSGLREYHETLQQSLGPQHWWPGDTPFEIMVGAILTQNTAWTNVEKAVANLKAAGTLSAKAVDATDARTLARMIRPAGYFNVKAKRLKSFVRWFLDRYGGDVKRMKASPLSSLREELLAVKGIGPETADSILLYALDLPSFVVDAYTYRVLRRHGLVLEGATYDEMKEMLEGAFDETGAARVRVFNEFHALLVAVGKDWCKPTPRCETCPLRAHLPRGGPEAL